MVIQAQNNKVKEAHTESTMQLILESLLLGEKLTQLDGPRFNTTCVTQRVSDLRLKYGWPIKCTMIEVKSGKHVMQYSLYKDFKG